MLARNAHVAPTDIMFTSNNTSEADFLAAAAHGGCILNLDDISLIGKVPLMPELICFRYNPGAKRSGNAIISKPWSIGTQIPNSARNLRIRTKLGPHPKAEIGK